MDDKTREALEESIEHWEQNAEATTADEYSTSRQDCALCGLFWRNDPMDSCSGCPVSEAVQQTHCWDTPYVEARDAKIAWKLAPGAPNRLENAREAAQEEVRFLKSLLPN